MDRYISIRYDEQGLVPAIVQDANSGQVLMLAYMNEQALQATLDTGEAHFWSRSRQKLWHKGAGSGSTQAIHAILVDCDADALLIKVHPAGPACHTGEITCFYRSLSKQLAEKTDNDSD
jgi:phosphoribosyl-AMP cyclohydrolase